MWDANMDFQFVLDPYAAAMYISRYMHKGERDVSKTMAKFAKSLEGADKSVQQKIKDLGCTFINTKTLSAQQASKHVLGMKDRRCSRSFVFVDTNLPEERSFL